MSERKAPLGPFTLTNLVIANMIGAGVFTTSGYALETLGTPNRVMAAWLGGGLLAICGALCYSALSRRLSQSGGEYLYLSRVIHPLAGFIAGWVSLLAGFTGATAFAALTFESYALIHRPDWLPRGSLAIAIILISSLAHGARVRTGAFSQNTVVTVKLALIVIFILVCLILGMTGSSEGVGIRPEPPAFTWSLFAGSLVWISLSYSGFNAAIYVAGEAENPIRNVPRAMLWGTVLVTVLYLALNAVFLYLPSHAAVAGEEAVAAAAAESIGGTWLNLAVRGLIALALATSVSSMMMAGPRVYARMADDGMFPQPFGMHGKPPREAIVLQALIAIVAITIADIGNMLSYLGFTLSLCAAFTVTSLFVLRRREGGAAIPVAGYPIIPIIFIGGTVVLAGMAAVDKPTELIAALVTIVSGSLVYLAFRIFHGPVALTDSSSEESGVSR